MISKSWDNILKNEYNSEYFKSILKKVEKEYNEKIIYPKKENIFNAFKLVPYEDIKIVIIGQDPYHGEGEAHGLAFSVQKGIKIPPSLKNIFKELKNEYEDFKIPTNGDLTSWANQGVLLINSTLTVEKDKANSHKKIGWNLFTNKVIEEINKKNTPVVFLLWGNFAIQKKDLISNNHHLILESVHPSPLSASKGFFGNNHFKKSNEFLHSKGLLEINWNLD